MSTLEKIISEYVRLTNLILFLEWNVHYWFTHYELNETNTYHYNLMRHIQCTVCLMSLYTFAHACTSRFVIRTPNNVKVASSSFYSCINSFNSKTMSSNFS